MRLRSAPAHRLDALGKSSLVDLAHCLFGTLLSM
jgi:hypothetical protein